MTNFNEKKFGITVYRLFDTNLDAIILKKEDIYEIFR